MIIDISNNVIHSDPIININQINNISLNIHQDKINNALVYTNKFISILSHLVFFILNVIILVENDKPPEPICNVIFNYVYLCCCENIVISLVQIFILVIYYVDKRGTMLSDTTIKKTLLGYPLLYMIMALFGGYVHNKNINECMEINHKLVNFYYANILMYIVNFVIGIYIVAIIHFRRT